MSASGPASIIGAVTLVERTTSTSARVWRRAATRAVVLELRVVDHLAPGGLQAVDARTLELVGDENDHRNTPVKSA